MVIDKPAFLTLAGFVIFGLLAPLLNSAKLLMLSSTSTIGEVTNVMPSSSPICGMFNWRSYSAKDLTFLCLLSVDEEPVTNFDGAVPPALPNFF